TCVPQDRLLQVHHASDVEAGGVRRECHGGDRPDGLRYRLRRATDDSARQGQPGHPGRSHQGRSAKPVACSANRRGAHGAAPSEPRIFRCALIARPEFDSWEAHGGVWSASRLRQNKYLRVREGRFWPKRLDTWISQRWLPTARVAEYYWIHVLA